MHACKMSTTNIVEVALILALGSIQRNIPQTGAGDVYELFNFSIKPKPCPSSLTPKSFMAAICTRIRLWCWQVEIFAQLELHVGCTYMTLNCILHVLELMFKIKYSRTNASWWFWENLKQQIFKTVFISVCGFIKKKIQTSYKKILVANSIVLALVNGRFPLFLSL